MKNILVCGAGGFIGGHLVKRLKQEGFWVRAVDLKAHAIHIARRGAGASHARKGIAVQVVVEIVEPATAPSGRGSVSS